MAYKVIILYQLYMPSYFLGTFTEYPEKVGWKNRLGIPVILPGIGYMPAIFVSVAAYRPGFPSRTTGVHLWWDVRIPGFSHAVPVGDKFRSSC